MAYLPSVCIVTDAAVEHANLVWIAMGRGPSFSRRLTTETPPTEASPVTHWLFADSSSTPTDVAAWQAMQNGDLPPLPAGIVWGEEGTIDAADAMAAVTPANLQVYSASGNVEPLDHVNGILASRGLHFIPSPEA